MSVDLSRVDSAVSGLSMSPKDEKSNFPDDITKKTYHRRKSSVSDGIWNIKDLGTE